jgi:hypothetical protein
MPLILAGFSWIARFFALILPWVVEFFGKWMTRRLAVAAAIIAAFLALTAAFYVSVLGILQTITIVTPPEFSNAVTLFLPSNTAVCIAAVLATYVARWLYDLQLRVLSYSNPGAGF